MDASVVLNDGGFDKHPPTTAMQWLPEVFSSVKGC